MKFLKNKRASGSIETAIAVIITVVLGGVALVGLTSIIDTAVYNNIQNSFDKKTISSVVAEDYTELDISKIAVGDCNMNGTIDAYDVEYLERGLAGWDGYVLNNTICDVLPNGVIDEQDVSKLKEKVYNLNKSHIAARSLVTNENGQKASQKLLYAPVTERGGSIYENK